MKRSDLVHARLNPRIVDSPPAQFRGQRAESVGVDDGLRLVGGEAAGGDEGDSAVVLGCGGDGVVFGRVQDPVPQLAVASPTPRGSSGHYIHTEADMQALLDWLA